MAIGRRGFLLGAGATVAAGAKTAFATSSASVTKTVAKIKVDVAVIGGSTTGVFAAVRAAEAGMTVVLVENNAMFGGTATAGMVPIWHSPFSMSGKRIVSGLSKTVVDRLVSRGEAVRRPFGAEGHFAAATVFNASALTVALDELVLSNSRITAMLSTRFVAADTDGAGRVTCAYVEDKDGRKAIEAKFYIDCTGDADLLERAGFETWKLPAKDMQAHTLCALVANENAVRRRYPDFSYGKVLDPASGGGFKHVFGWGYFVPGCPELSFNAFTRVSSIDPSVGSDLTKALFEARAQLKAIIDHANKIYPMPEGEPKLAVASIAPMLGVRESRHARCLYSVSRDDVLSGRTFTDVIARGTYRIDIHEGKGIRFLNLDGTEQLMYVDDAGKVKWRKTRWREEGTPTPECYSIPYRAIVPKGSVNVLCAGRMIDCSRDAYGALRVMMNCNQMGEAAGAAAAKAIKENLAAPDAYAGVIGQ